MEETRGRGRPKKLKLVTIDSALEIVREHFLKKGVSERDVEHCVPARKTIYNKISAKLLKNHGSRALALLDEDEVRDKLCS